MKEAQRHFWRVHFLPLLMLGVLTIPAFGQLSVQVIGNTISVHAGGGKVSSDTSYCVTAVVLDEVKKFANGNAPPCYNVPLVNTTFYCNWTGQHVVRAYAYNPSGSQIPLGQQTVTVFDPPPASCNMTSPLINFDITNAASPTDRRVLISNLNTGPGGTPNYPYPQFQALLARDKVIPVNLRTIYNAAATSGIDVTLTVIDPADPSPYIAGGTGIVQPVPGALPNTGTLPKIKGTGVIDNNNGTYSVTSGSNGYIETELELDPTARGGDNYQVRATATFPNGTTKSELSGVITVWKRLFVEKRNMHRRGAPLATDAPMGVTNIIVPREPIATAGLDEFRRNHFVMLLHAPTWGQSKAPGTFHSGIYQIIRRPERVRGGGVLEPGPGTVTTTVGGTMIVGDRTRFNRDFLSGDVITVGSDRRYVIAVIDNTHLTVDQPTTFAATGQPYDIGDTNLLPDRAYLRLHLDRPLGEDYVREPLVDAQSGVLTLNDAVVSLGAAATLPGEYFDVSEVQLTGKEVPPWTKAFPAAYAEYVVLPPSGGTLSPLPRMRLRPNDPFSQRFIDKWFSLPTPVPLPSTDPNPLNRYAYLTPPNHQLLLIGDTDPRGPAQAGANGFLCKELQNEKASVINRATVEYHVTNDFSPLNNADPDTVLRRTLVHEIVHQWLPNTGIPAFGNLGDDHCHPTVAYDSAVGYPSSGNPPAGLRFCLMSRSEAGPSMPAPWNSSIQVDMVQYFYRDGVTSMHIIQNGSAPHSEYLSIRNTEDPWRP